ncbi:RidA family protein [Croceicoccus sp. YJ47]|uniref:RidA family protein n=1 Tax=Croceicoccus sp. YJ47 TaxID=2798724 RepID=UPI001F3D838C|nr:RidA family protein [Croceicoccus sp. YJ47]
MMIVPHFRPAILALSILLGMSGQAHAHPGHADTAPGGEEPASIERHTGSAPGLILQAVTVRPGTEMLYLSGQLASPIDEEAVQAKDRSEITAADYGDTKTQTISTLNKIAAILAEHGYTMSDVIKMTAFVAAPEGQDAMDFAGFNEGFRQFFNTADNPNTLARSTVQVAALAAPQFLVELEVVAAK